MQNRRPLSGCCGWSEAKAKYFADFQTVELQSTFYELPSLALAGKWRALAPASFHFCLKAWQLITHTPASPTYRKLKSKIGAAEHDLVGSFRPTEQVTLAWERTADVARALAARVVLFQCPASFRPDSENLRNLRQFFSHIRREQFQLAWEPRGEWPSDLVAGLCEDLDLLHCIDPFEVNPTAVSAPYWRLHGKGGYSYQYSDDDLEELLNAVRIRVTKVEQPQYIFFNNIWMKEDALRFQERLEGV
ncbi:MAG: hypothetical protein JWP08_896 [Bryobacterales bacterium]|nr:hypothetical protein [Bryobacterales bacterium]